MKSSRQDLPTVANDFEGTIRQVHWGGMTIEAGDIRHSIDITPLLKGLPNDRCQCPHWGYVLEGQIRYTYDDHEEVYSAGEVYYAPPGHTAVLEAGCEYIELSPTDELSKAMEVVELNMKVQP
jgi:hypothetical protein